MAAIVTKGGRGKPTAGREFTAHCPLPPAKGAAEKMVDATDKVFLRMRANDSILKFLGLPLANIREIYANPATPTGPDGPNPKVRKLVADKISANPWTLILLPGTQIDQGKYVWYEGANAADNVADKVELKTIQIFLPKYIQAWRVVSWLKSGRDDYDKADGSKSIKLAKMDKTNYPNIIGVTTPNGLTYNWDSILYEDDAPDVDTLNPAV